MLKHHTLAVHQCAFVLVYTVESERRKQLGIDLLKSLDSVTDTNVGN